VNLKNEVLDFFKKISEIPRKSNNEEGIAQYIVDFAKARNLKYFRDELNNVIVWKNASKGFENKDSIILQCHTDMICNKEEWSKHDFLKDPIEVIIDGDYIRANGTTLGADNGIGVAFILAILNNDKLQHPKIEAVFTVQEETTMNGAKLIDLSQIQGNRMISFDNMSEDEFWVGCASCKEWIWSLNAKREKIDLDKKLYELKISGLLGGHSGIDINKNRGNALKILAELLYEIRTKNEFKIYNICGGTRANVIPTFAVCELFILPECIDDVNEIINKCEYNQNIKISEKEIIENVSLDKETTNSIIDFLYTFPNGVIESSEDGEPIVSANLGAIISEKNVFKINFSTRSNNKCLEEKMLNNLYNIKPMNFNEEKYATLSGYEADLNCDLIKTCKKIYFSMFNREVKTVNMHVGLEAGFFNSKIDNLEFISISPNIYDAHSPKECCSISSINNIWKYTVELLKNI